MLFSRKKIWIGILIAIALISLFVFRPMLSRPEQYKHSTSKIDTSIETVIQLATASTLASVAISAIPDDTATPIANQLAELSDIFLAILAVLWTEKLLQPLLGLVSFGLLIPCSCFCLIVYCFDEVVYKLNDKTKSALKSIGIKLLILAILLYTLIPCSLMVSGTIEDMFEDSIQSATNSVLEIGNEITKIDSEEITETIDEQEEKAEGGFFLFNWIRGAGDAIGNAASSVGNAIGNAASSIITGIGGVLDSAKQILTQFIRVVAIKIVIHCLVPAIVLIAYIIIIKNVFHIKLDSSDISRKVRHGVVGRGMRMSGRIDQESLNKIRQRGRFE